MSENTGIQWTDHSWNPWHGCIKISPGCKNCYMYSDKKRYGQDPTIVTRSKTTFNAPLRWKEPKRVFTCSWSDWLIAEADGWRDEAYAIIRLTPHLTYQILTKRIERAAGRVPDPPLPNVWLGVSVEDRKHKNRIDILRETPAVKRFVSFEPLLADLGELDLTGIDWAIWGGESGPGARPLDADWIRRGMIQASICGTKNFVKQFGSFWSLNHGTPIGRDVKGGDPAEWPEWARVREFPA